ncbi:hypothetical protein D3C87_2116120 [compost metagenome]
MQGLADRIVEVRTERVHRYALAGDVLDAFDRAAFQHVEDRLHFVIDAVGGIGGHEIVAADNRVQHGRCRRTADLDVAGGQRDQ